MRKILTKEEVEKKQRKNKLIVGLVLISTMLLSTIGYAILSNEGANTIQGKIKYKGIEFIKNSNG